LFGTASLANPLRDLNFLEWGRRNASTNEAQTLPLTANVRFDGMIGRGAFDRNVAVRTRKSAPAFQRKARFRFARTDWCANDAVRVAAAGCRGDSPRSEKVDVMRVHMN